MLWHVYLRKSIAYVPTVAQTEAGYYLDVEPVAAVPATDANAVQDAVKQAISRGNPKVPTPTRAAFPKPFVLKYAKVRSWADFERTAALWTILRKDGCYQIKRGRKRIDAGWEDDPSQIETLPVGAGLDDVARRVFSAVQSAT
jgi:hypothetical protein